MKTTKHFKRILFPSVLFLFAFVIRAISAHHGAPFGYHNDEHWIFKPAFLMNLKNSWDPEWYVYPPLTSVLFRLLIVPFLWIHPVSLFIPKAIWLNPASILPYQFPVLYLGRLMMAAFGAGTCVLLYLILRKYMQNKYALAITFLYAASPKIIFFTSYLRPEPLMVFFLVLAFFFLVKYQQEPIEKTKWIWLSSLALGFAMGSKYNASFFFLTTIFVIWIEEKNVRKTVLHSFRTICGSLIGFTISNPQFLFKPFSFFSSIEHNYHVYRRGDPGNMGSHAENVSYYLHNFFTNEAIGYVFVFFLFSILIYPLLKKRMDKHSRNTFLASSFFAITYFVFICQFKYRAERVAVPIQPFIFISAGIALGSILETSKKFIQDLTYALTATVLVLASLQLIQYIDKCNSIMPQDLAMLWIEKNTLPKSRILKEFDCSFVDPVRFQVAYTFSIAAIDPKSLTDLNPDYLVLNQFLRTVVNDSGNSQAQKIENWLWSLGSEFENDNPGRIPLGIHVRIINFQKYKQAYETNFLAKTQ